MKVVEIENRDEYNSFVVLGRHSQFLQSWEWGEMRSGGGRRVIRLGFFKGETRFFVLSLLFYHLPFGKKYLYAPRIDFGRLSGEQLKFVFVEIEKIAMKEKAIFLRLEAVSESGIQDLGYRVLKTIDWQPARTLILNLSQPEEELLGAMHQKTRYNVRLSQKKGVTVRFVEQADEQVFDDWWKIMEETRARDGFRLHSRGHYEKMIKKNPDKVLIKNSGLDFRLMVAEFEGKVIAGNILAFFGDMVTYVHGASSDAHRNAMAPYLLQWEAMKMAKGLGFQYYDMHGIDEKKWPGVTRFKLGFGGERMEYSGTFDLVYDSLWYNGYRVLRGVIRKLKVKSRK